MKLTDKKYLTSNVIGFSLLGLIVGLIFLLVNADFLIKLIFVIMGIITVITSIPTVVMGLVRLGSKDGIISLILGVISALLGFVMIFLHSSVLMILLGVFMLVMPLLEILAAPQKGVRFKAELPKMIFGLVMIIIGPGKVLNILFDVVGWGVLALTLIYVVAMLLGSFVVARKQKHKTGGRIFVDSTGDGVIDEVHTDIDGDGKPDTAEKYKDRK